MTRLICSLSSTGDEVGGISVSVRERDDVVTIWNTSSALAEQSKIIEKIQELLPSVNFSATFYKGKDFITYEGQSKSSWTLSIVLASFEYL